MPEQLSAAATKQGARVRASTDVRSNEADHEIAFLRRRWLSQRVPQ